MVPRVPGGAIGMRLKSPGSKGKGARDGISSSTILSPAMVRFDCPCCDISNDVEYSVAKIAFVIQSYMMKTAFVPSSAVIGKFPVRSACIVPSFVLRAPNAMNNWLDFSVALG
eukprot:scaffold156249_cov52-Attheya_sp.AAC.1